MKTVRNILAALAGLAVLIGAAAHAQTATYTPSNPASVAITGGTINGTQIGSTSVTSVGASFLRSSSGTGTPDTAQTSISGQQARIQGYGLGATAGLDLFRFSANSGAPQLTFNKSRGATVGSYTVVANNDDLMSLTVGASDGTDLAPAFQMLVEVDGSPGNDDMPGRVTFSTTKDGANAVSDVMRLDSKGHMLMIGTAPTLGTGGSDCGTSPTLQSGSNDNAGKITVGTSPGGKCTITFAVAWAAVPSCVVQNETSANLIRPANTSTSAVEFTGTLTAADKLAYQCVGF